MPQHMGSKPLAYCYSDPIMIRRLRLRIPRGVASGRLRTEPESQRLSAICGGKAAKLEPYSLLFGIKRELS